MKNLLNAFLIIFVSTILIGCSIGQKQEQQPLSMLKEPVPVTKSDTVLKQNTNNDNDDEKTVVVNVTKFGRADPFKTYQEKSILTTNINFPRLDIPQPPKYNTDPNLSKFLATKVSGILYDPSGSTAIITVDKNDYLVHKGDSLFDFHIQNINPTKVIIKYQNNIYKVGIGDFIEGNMYSDPVQGTNKFANTQKLPDLPSVKLINP